MVRPIVKLCILYDGRCEDIPVLKVILGANELKVTLILKKKTIPKLNQLTRVFRVKVVKGASPLY